MVEVLTAERGVRFVYRAEHNEEGGRFWQKSNENIIAFLDDESVIETDMTMFCWASLSQIRELALMDNVVSPFVKTIVAPLLASGHAVAKTDRSKMPDVFRAARRRYRALMRGKEIGARQADDVIANRAVPETRAETAPGP